MKRIGLFCGGFSSEYAISILSANTIQANFPKTFEVVKIVVSKDQWLVEFQGTSVPFDLNTCQFTHEGIQHKIDIGLV